MLTVLVGDDSKTMRMRVARVVREVIPDANVVFAKDGAEVLRSWCTHPHLTILDVHMPVLNALELMRQAVATGIGVPPTVIYTASRDGALRRQLIEAGAMAVVTKSQEELGDVLAHAVQTSLRPPRVEGPSQEEEG